MILLWSFCHRKGLFFSVEYQLQWKCKSLQQKVFWILWFKQNTLLKFHSGTLHFFQDGDILFWLPFCKLISISISFLWCFLIKIVIFIKNYFAVLWNYVFSYYFKNFKLFLIINFNNFLWLIKDHDEGVFEFGLSGQNGYVISNYQLNLNYEIIAKMF